jgi:DNA-binding winged helix-turn-helix (wHTH) protein/predicted ATPase
VAGDRLISFSPFTLNLSRGSLSLGAQPIPLRPKSFAVLQYLIENPDRLVSKAELIGAVWPKTRVVEGALKVSIGEIRKALGDNEGTFKFIETVGKKGYRFVAPLSLRLPEFGKDSFIPFVGRAAELVQLRHYLEIAHTGKRQVVFVTGEPGIGKTTLVEAFLKTLPPNDSVITAHGQCIEQYGASEAYLPILDSLDRMCNGPNRQCILQLLRQYAPSWLVNLPHIIDPTERSVLEQQTVGLTPERRLREIAACFETLAKEQTLLLVLEDLHWVDPSTLALIAFLAQRQEAARLMLIGTYRESEIQSQKHPLKQAKENLQLHHKCSQIPLRFLTRSAVGEYLTARFETPLISKQLFSTVYRRSEGNPLFMVGVTDYLIAREAITLENGSVEIADKAEKETTPATIRQLIERQFERLDPEDRELLEVAGVYGMSFSAAVIARTSDMTIEEVEKQCDRLVDREHFLQRTGTAHWPDGTVSSQYSFIHALYQNVIYDRIGDARKTRLNQTIGMTLEAGYAGATEEIAAELTTHFERARDQVKTARYLLEAAQRSFKQCAFHETLNYTKRGLETAPSLPDPGQRSELELRLQLLAATALSSSQGYASPDTKNAFDRAYEISRAVRNDDLLFQSLAGLWSFHLLRGQIDQSLKIAQRMLELACRKKSDVFDLNAHMAAGCSALYLGKSQVTHEHLSQSLRHYDPKYYRDTPSFFGWDTGVISFCYDAQALWFVGLPSQAERSAERARALMRQLHSPFNEALCHGLLSLYYAYSNEPVKLLETTAAGIKVSTEGGFLHWLALTTLLHGSALCKLGKTDEGLSRLAQGIEQWRAAGAELGLPLYLGLMAEASIIKSSLKRATACLEEALTIAARSHDRHYDAELYRLQGELALARTGHAAEKNADGAFRRAIKIAQSHKSKTLELRATTSLCRLWRNQSKHKHAREKLHKIYGWFTEGFDSPDLKQAKMLLDELG